MQIEFHQIERRGEHLRVQQPQQQKRLLASLAGCGQQTPIVVVPLESEPDRYVVIERTVVILHWRRRFPAV